MNVVDKEKQKLAFGMIEKVAQVQKMSPKQIEKLFEPFNELSPENLVDLEVNPNGVPLARYAYKNGYGARVQYEKDTDDYVVITVRQEVGNMGDAGPAVELDDWMVTGNLNVANNRLMGIQILPRRES